VAGGEAVKSGFIFVGCLLWWAASIFELATKLHISNMTYAMTAMFTIAAILHDLIQSQKP